jgi:uncharacterized protein (TIGR03437 family)
MPSKQFIKCLALIFCLAAPFYLAAQVSLFGSGSQPSFAPQINKAQHPFLPTPATSALAPSITNIVGAAFSIPPVTDLSLNGAFTIFGSQLAAATTYLSSTDIVNNQLPTNLGGTCVESGTTKWYLYYVSPEQINVLAGQYPPGPVPVTVVTNCGTPNEVSTTMNVSFVPAAPEFVYFLENSNGQNPIAAIDADTDAYVGTPGLIPGATFAPAHPGDVLTAYGVGWGATSPSVQIGTLASGPATLTSTYSLLVGGIQPEISYIGLSPGAAGLYQVNFTVPSGLAAGNQPLVLNLYNVAFIDGLDYLYIASTISNAFITVTD